MAPFVKGGRPQDRGIFGRSYIFVTGCRCTEGTALIYFFCVVPARRRNRRSSFEKAKWRRVNCRRGELVE